MPHLILEYSANLASEIDAPQLMERLARAAASTGVFPLAGIRVRCHPVEEYYVADGHADNAFLHLLIRLGHGRDVETRKRAGQVVFDALCDHLAPIYARRPLAISMEIVEIHPDLNFKQGNLRDYLKMRRPGVVNG
jgi:5-carboxymethyl-2-hydroxymuconate isomerase